MDWCRYDEPYISGYSNTGCLGSFLGSAGEYGCGDDEIVAEATGGVIHVHHLNACYYCCPENIAVTMTVEGNVLHVTETEITERCRCMCCYTIDSDIEGVEPGEYLIEYCWYDYGVHGVLCDAVTIMVSG